MVIGRVGMDCFYHCRYVLEEGGGEEDWRRELSTEEFSDFTDVWGSIPVATGIASGSGGRSWSQSDHNEDPP